MTDTQPVGPESPFTPNGEGMSLGAVTTLVHSFALMVGEMKRDLLREMATSSEHSKERWQRFEAETKIWREAMVKRVTILEDRVDGHIEDEETEELLRQAKIAPVRSTLRLLAHNWKSLFVAFLAILGALGLSAELLQDISKALVP